MYINVNNIKLHYEVIGEGKELILLNPNSDSTYFMKKIARKFSKNFKVYVVDRRCTGKSSYNCILTYEETAKDIIEMIKKLNLNKPYILGISGGARVLIELAISCSEYLSKIVICGRYSKI